MSVSEVIQDETPARSDPKARTTRRRVLIVLGVLLVVVAALVGVRVKIHEPKPRLHVFAGRGGILTTHAAIHQTHNFVGILQAQPPTIAADAVVKIDSITPVVGENSAHASISFVMCDNVGVTGGSNADLVRSGCTHPFSAIGANWQIYQYERPNNTIVVRVTAATSGIVELRGYRIRYHSGSRSGDQVVGDSDVMIVR
jgi:hypothetical protein